MRVPTVSPAKRNYEFDDSIRGGDNQTALAGLLYRFLFGVSGPGSPDPRLINADPPVFPPSWGLISRGELAEQSEGEFIQTYGPEFMALASGTLTGGVTVTTPAPSSTNVLESLGVDGFLEAREDFESVSQFATNYPVGNYNFTAFASGTTAVAKLPLLEGPLPSSPRVRPWLDQPYVILGQTGTLE